MSEPSPRLAEAMDMKLATTQAERDKREFLDGEARFAIDDVSRSSAQAGNTAVPPAAATTGSAAAP